MTARFSRGFAALSLASLALTLAPPPARACGGGMFTVQSETQTTTMSGHRVAISISTEQTVLWDQIKYQGNPKDFAWVMPVKTGAKLEVGADAWLEALDAATTTFISSPEAYCDSGGSPFQSGGGCCGSATAFDGAGNGGLPRDEQDPAVEVLHRETVGPYETVTLSSTTPGALGDWLDMHGYVIPADVKPILDDYAAQGFDFIAARLTPGQGVEQIKPLRVVTPGALTTFPMRMLTAGAQKSVALSLFVVTEGRSGIKGFPGATITGEDLTWDFEKHASDYAEVRAKRLAADSGRTFLTTYAAPRGLLGPVPLVADRPVGESDQPPIVADFFARALDNQESGAQCSSDFTKYIESMAKVTGMPGSGETDPSVFSCGKVDDLGVALTGLHPNDVWLMRFEADLPKEALTADLTIEPLAADQTLVANHLTAMKSVGDACASAAPVLPAGPRRLPPRDAALAAALLGLGAAVARRLARTGRARGIKAAST
jgi:Uncharacterized protein conserved in bacteria (DUF2330)